ncbi:hypothetical protein EVAR_88880_1 [Eumeta japonica]|uniref:Uncharacterized protein n=1 Tax=Eumeta variegata TaxID=151549 RepID=A0A4C1XW57_EUMVA|nr:hypothetical protein EVAR_88880_1 [Eumeta japonica]
MFGLILLDTELPGLNGRSSIFAGFDLSRLASFARPFSRPLSLTVPATLETVQSGGSHGVDFLELYEAARPGVRSLDSKHRQNLRSIR